MGFPFGRATLIVLLLAALAQGGPIDGYTPAGFLGEQTKTWNTDDGVRVLINAAGDFDPSRPTHLVIFALPNGNTIEWTLGARLEPGRDWHYDIQHVGAQVRGLRRMTPEENLVLALVEADTRSWPAWRKARPDDNGKRIRAIVHDVTRAVPGADDAKRLTLACHSGGGSFIFGYLNGGDAIGDTVARIAFLDANYGYADDEHHGDKLLAWLEKDATRTLVVIAYDDRDVKLGGKNIVSATGGTYRASHRMMDRLRRDRPLKASTQGPLELHADGKQVYFLIHANPGTKVLHTVLVERNGLLESLTLGTPLAGKWGGTLMGDRAYGAELIEPPPVVAAPRPATRSAGIPPRPAGARGGKAFAEQIADLPPQAREAAIYEEATRGNVPPFLREFVRVSVPFASPDGVKREATFHVSADYLAIGSDEDFFRVPMTPATATRVADAFGCALPTRKIVNDVYAAADVKLEPKPMGPPRETVERFLEHHALIEAQRQGKPLGPLTAGHKKDVVVSNRLKEKPNKVAIYGWHKPDGEPIQPLYVGHVDWYVDYSHGIRLVKREMTIDGKAYDVETVLKDPNLCAALSDEGVIDARYP